MQTILVAGVLNQPFGSWSAASQSNDGVSWTTGNPPFNINEYCTGIATDGINIAISNARGYLAITTDMINYTLNVINDGFGTTCLSQYIDDGGYNHWMAVGSYNYIDGYGPYPPRSEVAQIYIADSASSPWRMVWTHPNNGSLFYQVNYFTAAPIIYNIETQNVWITVGNNGVNSGDAYYSLDYGNSWTQVTIPVGVGIIYSVDLYQIDGKSMWIWGCNGKIFTSVDLHSSQWNEVQLTSGDTIIGITHSPNGVMMLNGVNNIYITFDGLEFTIFSQTGYVFNAVTVFSYNGGYRWLAFARSNLTQYTMWYTDNLVNWIPQITATNVAWEPPNNGIEVQAVTIS